jgi:hypothetical protein
MVEMGVLDPTKVTRYALQNAASVAGLILTTAAMVAELPRKSIPMAAAAWAAWVAWAAWTCKSGLPAPRKPRQAPPRRGFLFVPPATFHARARAWPVNARPGGGALPWR